MAAYGAKSQGKSGSRGTLTCASPLDIRFSQWKVHHQFVSGTPIVEVTPLVRILRCTAEEQAWYGAPWRLEAPFPAIEVVRWRCKIRDEITGRPRVDQSGAVLFDSEERSFTLDNRRLYCLQVAAAQVWPERCVVDIVQLADGGPESMKEVRKFRTVDSGKSIMIGSTLDGVPFQRWSWRTWVGIEETEEGEEQYASCAGGLGELAKTPRKPRKAKKSTQVVPSGYTGQMIVGGTSTIGAKAMIPVGASDGAAMGAMLLGLLKGPGPAPTTSFYC